MYAKPAALDTQQQPCAGCYIIQIKHQRNLLIPRTNAHVPCKTNEGFFGAITSSAAAILHHMLGILSWSTQASDFHPSDRPLLLISPRFVSRPSNCSRMTCGIPQKSVRIRLFSHVFVHGRCASRFPLRRQRNDKGRFRLDSRRAVFAHPSSC